MRFTHCLAAALALVPAVQVFAAPTSVTGLSTKVRPTSSVKGSTPPKDIAAGPHASIDAIEPEPGSGDSATELIAMLEALEGDRALLEEVGANGENGQPTESGISGLETWGVVVDAIGITTDIVSTITDIIDVTGVIGGGRTGGGRTGGGRTGGGRTGGGRVGGGRTGGGLIGGGRTGGGRIGGGRIGGGRIGGGRGRIGRGRFRGAKRDEDELNGEEDTF
ncbi:hypothetical protein FS749_006989 [Ceratobasidium sp. UAMH 11750]|nr:hypothetical protein FS749_006989 [Ceratobasidium sp. UAMH 11750]